VKGLVIRNTGSWYTVLTDDGQEIESKIKGNFRLKGIRSTNPVSVGDNVHIALATDGSAYITDIEARRNYIIRRASNLSKESHIIASNLDQALLLVTLAQPLTSTLFIDRFLVTAEAYKIPAVIAFNKTDLLTTPEDRQRLDEHIHLYTSIGYPCYTLSATNGDGLEPLRSVLVGKTTLFSGHSGVGKSTLINRFVPEAHLRTGKISDSHHRGMHTTTYSEMLPLFGGGYLIDTPGIKGFGIIDIGEAELAHYFPELFALSPQCHFYNCTHQHEPDCAVLQALNEGAIPPSRYKNYLNILADKGEAKYRAAP
jgi:ribosome biogenesis GTPase